MKKIKEKTGTDEWSIETKNCILGCSNDCVYCFGRGSAIRRGDKTSENWHEMKYRESSRKEIRKVKGVVMFPSTHDLFYEQRDWWMPFLQGLLEKGNDMLIVSKPEFKAIELICNSFEKYKDKIEFRFTIGSDTDLKRKFWEPNVSSIEMRIKVLEYAFKNGWRTSISMEPLLVYYPEKLINRIYPYVTGEIWIGTMNRIPKEIKDNYASWYKEIKTIGGDENIVRIYNVYKDNPKIKWKDSIRKKLTKLGYLT